MPDTHDGPDSPPAAANGSATLSEEGSGASAKLAALDSSKQFAVAPSEGGGSEASSGSGSMPGSSHYDDRRDIVLRLESTTKTQIKAGVELLLAGGDEARRCSG